MSLWASARLSYGPCARAGVYAPMVSVRRVVKARVFIPASRVRHVGQPQRSRQVPNHGRKRRAGATGIARAASRVFDIREHLARSVRVAHVHVNLHGAGRNVEAAGEPPEPDQVLQALALAYERYTRGFERSFREREGDRVPGLEDRDELRRHTPGYFPRKSRRNPTVSIVPCAMTDTQRLRPVTKYKSPNTKPPNPAVSMPESP